MDKGKLIFAAYFLIVADGSGMIPFANIVIRLLMGARGI